MYVTLMLEEIQMTPDLFNRIVSRIGQTISKAKVVAFGEVYPCMKFVTSKFILFIWISQTFLGFFTLDGSPSLTS